MSIVLLDLRQALRSLLRAPAFLITSTACLALGLGANLAVISLSDRLVLRPLPFPDSSRLAVVQPKDNKTGETGPMTMADFLGLRAQGGSFQKMATCTARVRTLTGGNEPNRINVGMVTADFFGVLGVKPALGRVIFRAEEEVRPATVAVLRHDLWMKRFGGDVGVLGRTVILDGNALQVVGVLPADFRFYERISEAQVFTPEATPFAGRTNRGMGTFLTIGRLRPGIQIAKAQTEATVAAGRIGARMGDPSFNVGVSSLLERTASDFKPLLLAFLGAVAMVLLITCFNVAGLQLVRDMARSRELAIRQALGANWSQMVRLFLAESLILALLGGALGIGLSFYLQEGMSWLMKDLLPIPVEARLYPALAVAALGLSLVTGLGLALLSWFLARHSQLLDVLKANGKGSQSKGHWRVLKGLVVAEVALSMVLLLGAGLLIHTLVNLRRVDPGFHAEHVLTVRVPLPPEKYTLPVQQTFLRQLNLTLKAIPGVQEVGVNDTLPFVKATNASSVSTTPATGNNRSERQESNVRWHVISPDYFKTMGIPLQAGQPFAPSDPQACMLSHRLAENLWPGQDPLGRLVYAGFPEPFTVSGVVGDTSENNLGQKEDPQFYVSSETNQLFEGPVVVLKVQGDPARYAAPVKAAIRALDRDLALPEPQPMKAALMNSTSLNLTTVAGVLFSTFGAMALTLSAVGLYSVLSQATAQRRREIGIRISLGATQSRVVAGVLANAGKLIGQGLALGALGGWGLARLLNHMLFGLKVPGVLIYLGVLLLLTPSALLACLIPSLRAAHVNPSEALRSE